MDVTPLKTKRDHRRALKEIEGLMGAKRDTPDGDRLDVLVTLIEAFEAKHYPIDLPDPVEAIKYHMEQKGLAPRDLVTLHRQPQPRLRGAQPQAAAHASHGDVARVQVVNSVSHGDEQDHHIRLQWCRYFYDDGTMEHGYRFIWATDEGKLLPSRGQARLPSLEIARELMARADAEGWGNYVAGEGLQVSTT